MSASFENGTSPTLDPEETDVKWSTIFIGVCLYIIILATIFGNALVLIAFKTDVRLQTAFNYYIVNLAMTDFLVAITAMSFYTTNKMLGYWPFGTFMCAVWIFFDYGMTFASVFTLIVISLDRFWAVTWTVHYRMHHNKKKALKFILAVWIFMLVLWLPAFIYDRVKNVLPPEECMWDPSNNRAFVVVIACVGHHGPFLILLFCYVRVLYVVRKRRRVTDRSKVTSSLRVPTQNPALSRVSDRENVSDLHTEDLRSTNRENTPTTDSTGKSQRATTAQKERRNSIKYEQKERNVFITLSYIIVGYLICWVPFHFVFDISAFDPNLVSEELFSVTFWLTYFNSTVNPFLYNFSSPDFRSAFKRILRYKRN